MQLLMMTINDRMEMLVNEHFNGNKAAFAKSIDMPPTSMSSYLGTKRRSKPSVDMVARIIQVLNVNARWLLTGEGDMQNPSAIVASTMDKQRMLEELIDHYADGNKAKFARMLEVSPQTVSTWASRETFDAELIYTKCEGISGDWLLSGEGPMLKKDMPTTCQPSHIEELVFKLFDEVHKKRKV